MGRRNASDPVQATSWPRSASTLATAAIALACPASGSEWTRKRLIRCENSLCGNGIWLSWTPRDERFEVLCRDRGTAGGAERVADPPGGVAVGRFAEDGIEGGSQLGRARGVEVDPDPRARAGDLLGGDRLVEGDRREDERDAVQYRLAHGVRTRVAHHRVHV